MNTKVGKITDFVTGSYFTVERQRDEKKRVGKEGSLNIRQLQGPDWRCGVP